MRPRGYNFWDYQKAWDIVLCIEKIHSTIQFRLKPKISEFDSFDIVGYSDSNYHKLHHSTILEKYYDDQTAEYIVEPKAYQAEETGE
ncbi:hypothetical protein C1H46_039065 [Malus baccata]|uniref:Uncharacterized protein n=1 Tax=Malus baccata TaxID=106549 RepID=A0A540KMG2_MALBA|nr:hypothetical protein C1H46_039065 [Malus baccata]